MMTNLEIITMQALTTTPNPAQWRRQRFGTLRGVVLLVRVHDQGYMNCSHRIVYNYTSIGDSFCYLHRPSNYGS